MAGFVLAGYRCEASWERYQADVEAARDDDHLLGMNVIDRRLPHLLRRHRHEPVKSCINQGRISIKQCKTREVMHQSVTGEA